MFMSECPLTSSLSKILAGKLCARRARLAAFDKRRFVTGGLVVLQCEGHRFILNAGQPLNVYPVSVKQGDLIIEALVSSTSLW
jgi:hypothetical protein